MPLALSLRQGCVLFLTLQVCFLTGALHIADIPIKWVQVNGNTLGWPSLARHLQRQGSLCEVCFEEGEENCAPPKLCCSFCATWDKALISFVRSIITSTLFPLTTKAVRLLSKGLIVWNWKWSWFNLESPRQLHVTSASQTRRNNKLICRFQSLSCDLHLKEISILNNCYHQQSHLLSLSRGVKLGILSANPCQGIQTTNEATYWGISEQLMNPCFSF